MKFTSILCLISLVGSLVGAAEVKTFHNKGCKKTFKTYKNAAKNTCLIAVKFKGPVTHPKAIKSHSLHFNIPKKLTGFGYQLGEMVQCGKFVKKGNNCIDDPKGFTGASFGKHPFKGSASDSGIEEGEKCTSFAYPDELVLDDGHMFNVTGMDSDLLLELDQFAADGATVDDIPDSFLKYEIGQDGIEDRLLEMY